MKNEDSFKAFMARINLLRPSTLQAAPLYRHPRFASLGQFKKGESFEASIPTALRTWWIVGVVIIIALWVSLVPVFYVWSIVGWYTDSRGNFYEESFSYGTFLICIAVLLGVSAAIYSAVFPRIKITADREKITIGKYRYGWDNAAGMRVGYSIGGVEKGQKQWKFAGMRMAYGQWGHDLPYMANDYHSVAYVAWINQLLETIQHNSETVNDAAAGIKQQMY